MAEHALGTITFVISENHKEQPALTSEEGQALTDQFVAYFRHLLSKYELSDTLEVTGVQWTLGCVTIIVSIGVAAAAAGGGIGLVKFLKEYKDVREGLGKLLEDLKNARVWISKKLRWHKTDTAIPSNEEKDKTPAILQAMFEQITRSYQAIPPEQREYWAAGQEITVLNEKGDLCHLTIAVKREDIRQPSQLPAITGQGKPSKAKKKKR